MTIDRVKIPFPNTSIVKYHEVKGDKFQKRALLKKAIEDKLLSNTGKLLAQDDKLLNFVAQDIINNPNAENLYLSNDSMLSYFGPRVPKGAQILLAAAYMSQNISLAFDKNNKFNFIRFKNDLIQQGYTNIANELKKSYFENIKIINSTHATLEVKIGDENSDYYFSFPLVLPKVIKSRDTALHNSGILGVVGSFADDRSLGNLLGSSSTIKDSLIGDANAPFEYVKFGCQLTLTGHTHRVESLLQLSDNRLVSGAWDGKMKIWDFFTEEKIKCEDFALVNSHNAMICSLTIEPDNSFASYCFQGLKKIWNLNKENNKYEYTSTSQNSDRMQNMYTLENVTSADGQFRSSLQAKGLDGGNIVIFENTANTQIITEIDTETDPEVDIEEHVETTVHTGKRSILIGHTGTISSLALITNQRIASEPSDQSIQDGDIVSSSSDGYIMVWNRISKKWKRKLYNNSPVTSLTILPNGIAACGLYNGSIKIWNLETKKCITTLLGHKGAIRSLHLLSDGRLASGSDDKTIKIWGVEDNQKVKIWEHTKHFIRR